MSVAWVCMYDVKSKCEQVNAAHGKLCSDISQNRAAGDKRQNNFVNEALKDMHTPSKTTA